MTTDEMRDAIEELYELAIVQAAKLIDYRYGLEVPEGVTPQTWYVAFEDKAESVSSNEFDQRYAIPAAASLAQRGVELGLTHFARLQVQDRPAAKHRASARVHQRNRQFIVHAKGWKA